MTRHVVAIPAFIRHKKAKRSASAVQNVATGNYLMGAAAATCRFSFLIYYVRIMSNQHHNTLRDMIDTRIQFTLACARVYSRKWQNITDRNAFVVGNYAPPTSRHIIGDSAERT